MTEPSMYRIRFHGRGGQGMKTASRLLGTAFFLAGFEVQDAPRYGAERRGAPIFAYVRADRQPIQERGVIQYPDLVIVADDSLVPVPAAGVLAGLGERSVLLLNSAEPAEVWRHRLNLKATLLSLPLAGDERSELRFAGATCAGAAARLIGVIPREYLAGAIRTELAGLGEVVVAENLERALRAFDAMEANAGCVRPGAGLVGQEQAPPAWIELPFEAARVSAPAIHAAATSVQVRTGLWRTLRPVIDYERCNKCWWVCSTFCPDGAISVDEDNLPHIDYDHCKGCMVCVAHCPPHAIESIAEVEALSAEAMT